MVPEFPDLKPLCMADRDLLRERFRAASPAICDLSPANLYVWRDCQAPSLTLIHGNLCILLEPHAEPACFLEPLGCNNPAETARACVSKTGRISRAQARLADCLDAQEFALAPMRDSFDYVYCVKTLAELKGKRFDGKRNHIRKFAAKNPGYELHPLEPQHLGRAAALFERWRTQARKDGRSGALSASHLGHDCQHRALERAFEEYDGLGLFGGALTIRGEIQGFIVASGGAGGTAIAHFSYANGEIPGIYQTLLWEASRRLFHPFARLNLEEDLGIPGLRKTKLSWHPAALVEKFEIRFR